MYQTLHILLNINDPSYLIYILVLILIIGAILYFGKPKRKNADDLTEKEETLIDNATNKKQDAQDNNDLKENIVEYFESDDYKKYKERLEHIWERIEEKISG